MVAVMQGNRRPAFLSELLTALEEGLKQGGIRAQIDSEPVPGTKLHRVFIISPNFRNVRQGERQDLVWRIADETLQPENKLRISMMLTLTPAETSGAPAKLAN
jgi:hypothetical protein